MKYIEGDKKRIRMLASMGSISLILLAFTVCLSGRMLYHLYGQIHLLEVENRMLKEIIREAQPQTGEEVIREIEKMGKEYP